MYRDCRFLSITLRQCVLSKFDICIVKYKLALVVGICHPPPQELNHVLLQLLLFNTSQKEFRVESRVHTSPLCSVTSIWIAKYFHSLVLWAQFLYFSIARKTLKSVTVRWLFLWLAKLHKNSISLLEKNTCLIAHIPPSPKSFMYWPSPCLFGTTFQSHLKCSLPGCSPHFAPKET